MDDTTHVHQWGRKRRLIDRCHFTETELTCSICGYVDRIAQEREFRDDPLQIAFADEHCARCRALARGLEPRTWITHDTGSVNG